MLGGGWGTPGANRNRNTEVNAQEIVITARCCSNHCRQRARYDAWTRAHSDEVSVSLFFEGLEYASLGVPLPLPRLGLLARLCGCFEEGTLVATSDGMRPIEEIEVGDLALAWNEETGEVAPQSVTALIRPEPKLLRRVELRDGGGEMEIFHATTIIPGMSVAKAGSKRSTCAPESASKPPMPAVSPSSTSPAATVSSAPTTSKSKTGTRSLRVRVEQ